MKNSDFDKKIKNLIDGQDPNRADASVSKDRIWKDLQINSPKVFPFWRAAAGLLFLALIGMLLFTLWRLSTFRNQESLLNKQITRLQ